MVRCENQDLQTTAKAVNKSGPQYNDHAIVSISPRPCELGMPTAIASDGKFIVLA